MANKFCRSGATGTGTGASWANAYTTITAGLAGLAAGDTLFVADDHAESTAGAVTYTSPGTAASPCYILCADHTIVSPGSGDLKTGATAVTTGANTLAFGAGYAFWRGISFTSGSGAVANGLTIGSAGPFHHSLKNCALARGGSASAGASALLMGAGSSGAWGLVTLDNTTWSLGNISDTPQVRNARLIWRNTQNAIVGSVFPNPLFSGSTFESDIFLEGVDLSALGAGQSLSGGAHPGKLLFKDCKLGSGVTVSNAPLSPAATRVDLIRCDSGSTNYRNERYWFEGTLTTETTIVRTGGATDGTTPVSHKIVTTANSKWAFPFEAFPISIWNETVGSPVTVTVCGVWGTGSVPNNDDIWMDVEYLGDASTPMGSFNIGTKANILATGSALASDASTWGGSTTPFKFTATITPQKKGPIVAYIRCAKASTTFYIDPLITLS